MDYDLDQVSASPSQLGAHAPVIPVDVHLSHQAVPRQEWGSHGGRENIMRDWLKHLVKVIKATQGFGRSEISIKVTRAEGMCLVT